MKLVGDLMKLISLPSTTASLPLIFFYLAMFPLTRQNNFLCRRMISYLLQQCKITVPGCANTQPFCCYSSGHPFDNFSMKSHSSGLIRVLVNVTIYKLYSSKQVFFELKREEKYTEWFPLNDFKMTKNDLMSQTRIASRYVFEIIHTTVLYFPMRK